MTIAQKRLAKAREFPWGTIIDMHYNLEPIWKRHPEFLVLYISTDDVSKYSPSDIVDKVLQVRTKSVKLLFQY